MFSLWHTDVLYQCTHAGITPEEERTAAAYDMPRSLRGQRITQTDIEHWVWILSGGNPKEMLDRFLENPPLKHHMLLMRLLRWDIQDVRTLRKVILHVWEHILGVSQPDQFADLMDPVVREPMKSNFTTHGKILFHRVDGTFIRLISLLLYQVRRIWPAALPSIATMVIPYFESIVENDLYHSRELDRKRHRKLCHMYNKFLCRFSLPASISPLDSMSHNWNAQRRLLEYAGQFQPPLILDGRSYRAITTVLAAVKKSARESKVTALRSRDWPPWRIAQDGMDAQSTPREDSSRVLLALAQKENSGYAPSPRQDSGLTIIGGQELDGTPTIHTRTLIKQREGRLAHRSFSSDDQLEPAIWAKRIEATRDVQEAWSAFAEYQGRGGSPTQAMYFQMFVKLHYEMKRQSFAGNPHQQPVAPGDGREVLEVAKNNFSPSYQSQLEPPNIPTLYNQMISRGIRPSGRFLNFLIQRASSINFGFTILRQSKRVSNDAWLWLRGTDTYYRHELLEHQAVADDTFFAVVHLLCRFSPDAERLRTGGYPPVVREAKASTANPLSHAASLLRRKLPMYRPTWYALFQALAKKDVVISRKLAGDPKNCVLAWRALTGALRDFHDIGLELDPEGFRHICSAAFNTLPALQTLSTQEEVSSALDLLKNEFAKMSEAQTATYGTPRYLHQVSGYDLHLYVRVMGIQGEYEEILGVLRWVVANYEHLKAASLASRKEKRHTQKLLTAVQVFLMEMEEYMNEAENILGRIPDWEGWVSDEEVEEYVRFHREFSNPRDLES